MSDLPDLAALREAHEWVAQMNDPLWPGLTESDWAGLMVRILALVDTLQGKNERLRDALRVARTDVLLSVTALVDTLQGENERLRKYARHLPGCRMERILGPSECSCGLDDALSVSPAEKKQP